jgi:hypothetical protein
MLKAMIKMSVKTWILGIVLVLLGGANAGLVFSMIESRYTAALVAGGGFVIVGLYLIALVWGHQRPFSWWTFYTSHLHLLVVSLPMIGVRVMNPGVAFENLTVLGLPGPDFHQYSTFFYQFMLLGVVADSVRFYHKKKRSEAPLVNEKAP